MRMLGKAAARKPRRVVRDVFAPVPRARLHARIEQLAAWLQPQLPDVDPGDLRLVIECMLRPIGRSGRLFLIKEPRPGVFVF